MNGFILFNKEYVLKKLRQEIGYVCHNGVKPDELRKIFETLSGGYKCLDGDLNYYNPKITVKRTEFNVYIRSYHEEDGKIYPTLTLDFTDVEYTEKYLLKLLDDTRRWITLGTTFNSLLSKIFKRTQDSVFGLIFCSFMDVEKISALLIESTMREFKKTINRDITTMQIRPNTQRYIENFENAVKQYQ